MRSSWPATKLWLATCKRVALIQKKIFLCIPGSPFLADMPLTGWPTLLNIHFLKIPTPWSVTLCDTEAHNHLRSRPLTVNLSTASSHGAPPGVPDSGSLTPSAALSHASGPKFCSYCMCQPVGDMNMLTSMWDP